MLLCGDLLALERPLTGTRIARRLSGRVKHTLRNKTALLVIGEFIAPFAMNSRIQSGAKLECVYCEHALEKGRSIMCPQRARIVSFVSRTILWLGLLTPCASLSAPNAGKFAEFNNRLSEAELMLGLSCETQQDADLTTGLTSE